MNTQSYFVDADQCLKRMRGGAWVTALLALLTLVPFLQREWWWAGGQILLTVFLGVMLYRNYQMYSQRTLPWLVLSDAGLSVRSFSGDERKVKWSDIWKLTTVTTESKYGRQTILYVHLRDPWVFLSQLTLIGKLYGWLLIKFGYSPLFISEGVLSVPVDQLHSEMARHMTPNQPLHPDASPRPDGRGSRG